MGWEWMLFLAIAGLSALGWRGRNKRRRAQRRSARGPQSDAEAEADRLWAEEERREAERLAAEANEPEPGWEPVPQRDFLIAYSDADGVASKRRITSRYHTPSEGPTLLHAWCHTRKALRSFATERMTSITDVSTGRVRKDCEAALVEWGILPSWDQVHAREDEEEAARARRRRAAAMATFAELRRTRARPAKAWEIAEVLGDGLSVLTTLARADGRRTKAEVAVVVEYLRHALGPLFAEDEAALAAGRGAEDAAGFGVRIAALRARGELALVARYALLIVQADGKTKPEELRLLTALHAALAAPTAGTA